MATGTNGGKVEAMNNIVNRFHVCCDECHFVDGSHSKIEARQEAICHDHGPKMTVFDSMARFGCVDTWQLTEMGNLSGTHRRERAAR
jgi:Fe2+ or Zn2+ uptake regulation protein